MALERCDQRAIPKHLITATMHATLGSSLLESKTRVEIARSLREGYIVKVEPDWELIQAVERDICLFYHQLSEYNYIMGDLYWGSVYHLPYWEYLELRAEELSRERFIRDGCLVLIFAMAYETIDGAGDYLTGKLDKCMAAIDRLDAEDEMTKSLIQAVSDALTFVAGAADLNDAERSTRIHALWQSSLWVHREYVREYFVSMAQKLN